MEPLAPGTAHQALTAGAIALDLRTPELFAAAHVPGAVNAVFSRRRFAERVAVVLPPSGTGPRLVLVGLEEAVPGELRGGLVADLTDLGFPAPAGYLAGGVAAWASAGLPLARLPLLSHAALATSQPPAVLDVREPVEWETGIIAGATCRSLGSLPAALARGPLPGLDPAQPVAVICAAGVRSSTAASLLRRHGYAQMSNLVEGMQGWHRQGRPVIGC